MDNLYETIINYEKIKDLKREVNYLREELNIKKQYVDAAYAEFQKESKEGSVSAITIYRYIMTAKDYKEFSEYVNKKVNEWEEAINYLNIKVKG